MELILVIGITGILLALITPALTNIKSGSDFTNAVYGIQAVLENARTYAQAHHTHVFVGFTEVDSSVNPSISPQITTSTAPFGRVAVAVVASKDGTRQFDYRTSDQGSDWTANYSDGSHLRAMGKLQRYENLHFLVDFPAWTPTDHPNSKMARDRSPGAPYSLGNAASSSVTPFTWPLGSPLNSGYQYRFDRVIYFDPAGVARIATASNASEIASIMEIDLMITRGTSPSPTPSPFNQDIGNHAVVQIAPMSGDIRIYRP